MRTALRRMGNSSGVIIPKPLLNEIGAKPGDEIEMTVEDGRIVLRHPGGSRAKGGGKQVRRLPRRERTGSSGRSSATWMTRLGLGDARRNLARQSGSDRRQRDQEDPTVANRLPAGNSR